MAGIIAGNPAALVTSILSRTVEPAWKAGIGVVVAAGDDGRNNSAGTGGYGTIEAPGDDLYVITVGAMNTMGTSSRVDDEITSYSSQGPTLLDHVVKPDVVAPGDRLISLYTAGLTLAHLEQIKYKIAVW